MDIKEIPVEQLIPYEFNNKIHDETQVNRIANSIKEFGFLQPIVIDKNNVVIVGHGRLEGAKKLGLKTVPCLMAENLTDEQIKKYRILDNKLNESERDIDNLKLELEELPDLDFGDLHLDVSDLFPDLDIAEEETETVEDEAPEVQAEAKVVEYGDIFQLGNHRLMCGDSTKLEDVETLMDGEKADMVFTDPPYNVAYEGGSKKREMIKNDKVDDFYTFLYDVYTNCNIVMKDGAPIYVCHSELERENFTKAFIDCGFKFSSIIVWAKNNSTFSMNKDYKQRHEPIIYGWKGAGHIWKGGNCEDTVWEIKRPVKSELHPTMKPVELGARAIRNSSASGAIVYEPFGGSGSTGIACEQLERSCYMMELDPKYCEVIIKRFHNLNPDAEIKCLNREADLSCILKDA